MLSLMRLFFSLVASEFNHISIFSFVSLFRSESSEPESLSMQILASDPETWLSTGRLFDLLVGKLYLAAEGELSVRVLHACTQMFNATSLEKRGKRHPFLLLSEQGG